MIPSDPKALKPPASATRVTKVDSASDSEPKIGQGDFTFFATTPQKAIQPVVQKTPDGRKRRNKPKGSRRPGPKRQDQPVAGSSAGAKAQWKLRKDRDDAGLCRVEAYVPKTTRDLAQLQAAARGMRLNDVIAEVLIAIFK